MNKAEITAIALRMLTAALQCADEECNEALATLIREAIKLIALTQ